MLNRQVLVLNRHWVAVHVCTVRRALTLVCGELARVVTDDFRTHDFASWRELSAFANDSRPLLHTPQFQLLLPQVIVLMQYQRVPPRTVKFNRRNIFHRDRNRCQYCGGRPIDSELTIDHIIPRSRGGRTVWENVVVACTRCNVRKGSRLPEECGMIPLAPPRKPTWLAALTRAPLDHDHRSLWQNFIDTAYWETNLIE
jgi:5-methylcytosine-specific restriction endonuclease McrA